MVFDYSKLRGRIVEVLGSQSELAGRMGTHTQTLSAKLSGKIGFTIRDILLITDILGLSKEDIGTYFFTQKV